uniref:NADH-ubiquinone oxidoreductase chain 3 n=1 Tax=Orbilia oligospora TaxID=2813651 RepID=A0A6G6A3C4_ORBOL|nr:NADH dehydrogenase subunit 3 [Orbilia oligospora]QID02805.1 NADH dehydrogenase subunit 3 [Orbilia oligospora]QID02846.1 NADH dehydrogenase subunit 3 [Orbilia oligospora]
MSSNSFYLLLIPIINILLLYLNILLGPNKNYGEKGSSFECGFHSFLGQNRQQFNISFFLFGLLFLIFDLEIILIYPFTISSNHNYAYGMTIIFTFLVILTVGFCYEIGKKALKLNTKQSAFEYVSLERSILKSPYIFIKPINENIKI